MTALIPNRFLFSFEFPLSYRAQMPALTGRAEDWTDADLLPKLGDIDGSKDFADLWACWNETGLAIAGRVTGKKIPLQCDPKNFWSGDNLRLCMDTRDARANKRATRYCQQFYFLPTGGGREGRSAVVGSAKIQRAKEDAPPVASELLRVASHVTRTGYTLEGFIPAECLSGFNPIDHPRIGFYYILEDAELGSQFPTVGDDLYWFVDPSTWPTATLQKTEWGHAGCSPSLWRSPNVNASKL